MSTFFSQRGKPKEIIQTGKINLQYFILVFPKNMTKKNEPPFPQQDVPVMIMVAVLHQIRASMEKAIAIAMTIALVL